MESGITIEFEFNCEGRGRRLGTTTPLPIVFNEIFR
jgi:hypothetical protein